MVIFLSIVKNSKILVHAHTRVRWFLASLQVHLEGGAGGYSAVQFHPDAPPIVNDLYPVMLTSGSHSFTAHRGSFGGRCWWLLCCSVPP